MKVPVLQANEAPFRRCRWWSDWVDVAVFDYVHSGYLLQMKVNRINGKSFRAIKFTNPLWNAELSTGEAGALRDINKDETR